MLNYYEVLGASPNASREELKNCYHDLIREHHPDKSSNQTGDNFCLIQKAWETLSDAVLRQQYDAQFKASEEQTSHPVQEEVHLSTVLYNDEMKQYRKECRCGGCYIFHQSDISEDLLEVDCDNCSLSILIDCQVKKS